MVEEKLTEEGAVDADAPAGEAGDAPVRPSQYATVHRKHRALIQNCSYTIGNTLWCAYTPVQLLSFLCFADVRTSTSCTPAASSSQLQFTETHNPVVHVALSNHATSI